LHLSGLLLIGICVLATPIFSLGLLDQWAWFIAFIYIGLIFIVDEELPLLRSSVFPLQNHETPWAQIRLSPSKMDFPANARFIRQQNSLKYTCKYFFPIP
jgi:hypothetical protein